MKGRQLQVCVSLPPDQIEKIKQLSALTRVPMAAYFREALEDLMRKYSATLRAGASYPPSGGAVLRKGSTPGVQPSRLRPASGK